MPQTLIFYPSACQYWHTTERDSFRKIMKTKSTSLKTVQIIVNVEIEHKLEAQKSYILMQFL